MRLLSFIFLILIFATCDDINSRNKNSKDTNGDNVVVTKYGDGNVRAKISMKNGKKNGLALEYFQSGKIYREINYVDGKKEGIAKRYFENGIVAQETMYKNDKIHGTQKKYRENGKPASIAEFIEDSPCKGVVEYFTDGKLKDNYPHIIIKTEDKVYSEGLFIVNLSLSEKFKDVEFYLGRLTKERIIDPNAKKLWSTDKNGNAQIDYQVMPGTFIMDKIHIIAKAKTPLGNYYITEMDYNVAAESR